MQRRITERLRSAARRLARLRTVLGAPPLARRDVIEHLSDGLLLADDEGVVADVNPAAEQILGLSRAGLVGRSLEEAMGRLGAKGSGRVLARRIARLPRSRGRVTAELETGDGRVLEVNAGTVVVNDEQPAGRFVLLRDRTSQRHFERLVRQRQKHESVGILAAGIAHEINNPLAFVRANMRELERMGAVVHARLDAFPGHEAAMLGEMQDVLTENATGIDRIAAIVEGLVALSRIPARTTTEICVNEAVESAIRYAALNEIGDLDVGGQLADDLPRVRASEEHLIQVLLALFLNARQALAGRTDGIVLIETRRVRGGAEIRVRDNGPGIPEDQREKIFDPFFTTRDPDQVAGLGLTSALDIVTDLGGTIEVASDEGEGACFSVRLPGVAD